MSVVVKGMDMPTNCLQCSFVRIVSDHYYCGCNANCMLGEYVGEYLEGVSRHEGCPLVELPSGHGRLVDAESLDMEQLYRFSSSGDGSLVLVYTKEEYPTVVEGEDEL